MASLKAMKYEQALLGHIGALKQMVLKHLDGSPEIQQSFLNELNAMFKTSHEEGRRLRKALAFLHGNVDSFKKQLEDSDIVPDEMYGRQDGQGLGTQA